MPANISVVRSLQNSLARRTAMTAGKRRALHELEGELTQLENTEPVQLLEEERLRKEIAELRKKSKACPLSILLIYVTRTMNVVLNLPARR